MVSFEGQAWAAGVRDPRVLAAMAAVPRELFVPPEESWAVARDAPVALPCGQTTSQPSLVALMVEALELGPQDAVLEVGSGWGYQAAVLSRLAGRVVTVEWHADLAAAARRNLAAFGATGVSVVVGDGRLGHPAQAPYDAVIVAARTDTVPPALLDQLADGGRLVLPLGGREVQEAVVLRIHGGAVAARRSLGPVRFVPLLQSTPR